MKKVRGEQPDRFELTGSRRELESTLFGTVVSCKASQSAQQMNTKGDSPTEAENHIGYRCYLRSAMYKNLWLQWEQVL